MLEKQLTLLATSMATLVEAQRDSGSVKESAVKVAPLVRLDKESVAMFLQGDYLNLMRLAVSNRKRLREAGVHKPKQVKLGSLVLSEELDLDPDGPSRKETATSMRLEGWDYLLTLLADLDPEVFPRAYLSDMMAWWRDVREIGECSIDRKVDLMDVFFQKFAGVPPHGHIGSWCGLLESKSFTVFTVLYSTKGGLSGPTRGGSGHNSSNTGGGSHRGGGVGGRNDADSKKGKTKPPKTREVDPSVILTCRTCLNPRFGECSDSSCRKSHVCLSCGKTHSATMCTSAGTFDKTKVAAAYEALKLRHFKGVKDPHRS